MKEMVSEETIIDKIYIIRGQKVMIDRDLAAMYGVETKVLMQAVKRNSSRFPDDFMFQLSPEEWYLLRSQIVTLEKGKGHHTKYLPHAFTEQGVAMLSSVLRSETAIQVNISIIRVYTKMRTFILDNKELWIRIEKIEQALAQKGGEIKLIFKYLNDMGRKELLPRNPIGFKIPRSAAGGQKNNKNSST
jgi:ORF6N domain